MPLVTPSPQGPGLGFLLAWWPPSLAVCGSWLPTEQAPGHRGRSISDSSHQALRVVPRLFHFHIISPLDVSSPDSVQGETSRSDFGDWLPPVLTPPTQPPGGASLTPYTPAQGGTKWSKDVASTLARKKHVTPLAKEM